jgi:hypothetical protein
VVAFGQLGLGIGFQNENSTIKYSPFSAKSNFLLFSFCPINFILNSKTQNLGVEHFRIGVVGANDCNLINCF